MGLCSSRCSLQDKRGGECEDFGSDLNFELWQWLSKITIDFDFILPRNLGLTISKLHKLMYHKNAN